MLARLKRWARRIRADAHALWFAARDPRTPRLARVLALALAAYALSPIDLIPDAIPVLGLLDEAILLPLGLVAVIRLVPTAVIAQARARAAEAAARPVSRAGAAMVVALWAAGAGVLAWTIWR